MDSGKFFKKKKIGLLSLGEETSEREMVKETTGRGWAKVRLEHEKTLWTTALKAL